MKKIKIYCKRCYISLSNELVEVNESELSFNDCSNLLPENSFIYWDNPEIVIPNNVNLFTTENSVNLKNSKNINKHFGCCGFSNLEFLNQVCPNCYNKLAIIFSDCWWSHFIAFDISQIVVKDFSDLSAIKKINFQTN